jgi:altronate dehydratase
MIEDMHLNCGYVLDGVSFADKGAEIHSHILRVA